MKNKRTSLRKTSDFGPGTEAHTLILKKKVWKLEVSRSSFTRFLGRYKKILVAVLAVTVVGLVTRSILVGFASTADFYPSSCLGNWENVQNALGKPDLPSGADATDFTTFNSAIMGTSTAQMFCGNFSGDTDIGTLTGKSFQEADLVLSWSFIFPEESSDTAIGAAGDTSSTPTSTLDDSSASSTGGGGGGDASLSSDASSPVTVSQDSASAPTSTADANTTNTATSSDGAATGDVSDQTPSSTVAASSSDTTPDDTSDQASSSTPAPTPTPTSTPAPNLAPPPAPMSDPTQTTTSQDPTSWLRNLVGIAYADEASSVADAASTTGISPYIQTGTSTVPSGTPINVNMASFQNIAIPSSTGDAVLSIVYSTDGVTWQPIVNIDSSNWQQARYQIPIHSWAELQNLQIAFVGLGASDTPQIFLDAAGVEVSYADAPQPDPDAVASDTAPAAPAPAPAVAAPAPAELPPVQAFQQVFDPFAGQQCSVSPFSESISAGGSGSFLLTMTPPAVSASSSASGTKARVASVPFLYDASVGSLPSGISATIVPEGPGVDAIGITALPSVAPGSYNAVVVYKERQHDGSVAPNFCQFNLVVTQGHS